MAVTLITTVYAVGSPMEAIRQGRNKEEDECKALKEFYCMVRRAIENFCNHFGIPGFFNDEQELDLLKRITDCVEMNTHMLPTNQSQGRGSGRRSVIPEQDSDSCNRREGFGSHASGKHITIPLVSSEIDKVLSPSFQITCPCKNPDRRGGGSSNSGYKNDEYNWRYENDDTSEDINRASVALENL
ncbi:hypothetical protein L2E82_16033 [Cichorium intybus]|uniref:Uncharacterized protein n=1 Tax=Cichorium intybus TaxID=13427 RepID=A0ACB9F5M5_CICIN|nr:hypothetical protein L2E82_16033 [Cichorium intybus]